VSALYSGRTLSVAVCACALSGLLVACGSSPSTPTAPEAPAPTPTPTPTPISYDGTWSGRTSQDHGISFTVTDDGVSSLTLMYEVSGRGCSVQSFPFYSFGTPFPIVDGAFDLSRSGGGTDLTMHGAFSSPTEASGTLTIKESTMCGTLTLEATWSATIS
jgi:hypothetical protein